MIYIAKKNDVFYLTLTDTPVLITNTDNFENGTGVGSLTGCYIDSGQLVTTEFTPEQLHHKSLHEILQSREEQPAIEKTLRELVVELSKNPLFNLEEIKRRVCLAEAIIHRLQTGKLTSLDTKTF